MQTLSQQGKLTMPLLCPSSEAAFSRMPLTCWGHQGDVPVSWSQGMQTSALLPHSLCSPEGFLHHLTLKQELVRCKSGIIQPCWILLTELQAPLAYALRWDSVQEQVVFRCLGWRQGALFCCFLSSSFDLLRKLPNDLVMSWVIRCVFHSEMCMPTGG